MEQDINVNDLIGETLTHIDVDDEDNQIMLTTQSGRQIVIKHYQDCCENVHIVDTEGHWHELIGKPIISTSHDETEMEDAYDHGTRTVITFRVDGATVISRWIGESNGYYSESVSLAEITKPKCE